LENQNVIRDAAYRPVRHALLQLWATIGDCAGRACQAPLPPELRASPADEARMTRAYWSTVNATYGWR
jgi:hypothetical protein